MHTILVVAYNFNISGLKSLEFLKYYFLVFYTLEELFFILELFLWLLLLLTIGITVC